MYKSVLVKQDELRLSIYDVLIYSFIFGNACDLISSTSLGMLCEDATKQPFSGSRTSYRTIDTTVETNPSFIWGCCRLSRYLPIDAAAMRFDSVGVCADRYNFSVYNVWRF